MTNEFVFSRQPELLGIRTMLRLGSKGAHIRISGTAVAQCGHELPLTVAFTITGASRDNPSQIELVERMLRVECTKRRKDAASAALDLTLASVNQYIKSTHRCSTEGEVPYGSRGRTERSRFQP